MRCDEHLQSNYSSSMIIWQSTLQCVKRARVVDLSASLRHPQQRMAMGHLFYLNIQSLWIACKDLQELLSNQAHCFNVRNACPATAGHALSFNIFCSSFFFCSQQIQLIMYWFVCLLGYVGQNVLLNGVWCDIRMSSSAIDLRRMTWRIYLTKSLPICILPELLSGWHTRWVRTCSQSHDHQAY